MFKKLARWLLRDEMQRLESNYNCQKQEIKRLNNSLGFYIKCSQYIEKLQYTVSVLTERNTELHLQKDKLEAELNAVTERLLARCDMLRLEKEDAEKGWSECLSDLADVQSDLKAALNIQKALEANVKRKAKHDCK